MHSVRPLEGRNVRPAGGPGLVASHVRVRRLVSIPAGNPHRKECGGHEDLGVRQSGPVVGRSSERIIGRLAPVGVRIEGHPANAGLVFATREPQVLGIALEHCPARLGEPRGRNDEVPPGVEGTADTLHVPLIGKHDGEQQNLGLGTGGEVGHNGDVGRTKAFPPTMQFEEGRNPLDLCARRAVPRRCRDERGGLVFDDVLKRASHSDRVESSVQEPILDDP